MHSLQSSSPRYLNSYRVLEDSVKHFYHVKVSQRTLKCSVLDWEVPLSIRTTGQEWGTNRVPKKQRIEKR